MRWLVRPPAHGRRHRRQAGPSAAPRTGCARRPRRWRASTPGEERSGGAGHPTPPTQNGFASSETAGAGRLVRPEPAAGTRPPEAEPRAGAAPAARALAPPGPAAEEPLRPRGTRGSRCRAAPPPAPGLRRDREAERGIPAPTPPPGWADRPSAGPLRSLRGRLPSSRPPLPPADPGPTSTGRTPRPPDRPSSRRVASWPRSHGLRSRSRPPVPRTRGLPAPSEPESIPSSSSSPPISTSVPSVRH